MQAHDAAQANRGFPRDRQSEAVTFAGRGRYPVERIEYTHVLGSRNPRTVIHHFDDGVMVIGQEPDRHFTARRRVFQGIFQPIPENQPKRLR